MSTRCQMYPSADAARKAAQAMLDTGTSPHDLRLVIGSRTHDVRKEPVGSFSGRIDPGDPVGTFAGPRRPRAQAPGGWAGDRSKRRHGSFSDIEHDEVVSFERGAEDAKTVDRHALSQLLKPITADHEHAGKLVSELHEGHALLLIATP
jgi:hypothetical protein